MTYYVAEVEGLHSFAKAERINAKSRSSAKRSASRYHQMFIGTILYLGKAIDSNGFIIEPIAVKKGDKWIDLDLDL